MLPTIDTTSAPTTTGARRVAQQSRAERRARDDRGVAPRQLRIAYLTTEYPKVSHTFIRREIIELERRGHIIERFAIRPSSDVLADPADREEFQRTFHCLGRPRILLIATALCCLIVRPAATLRSLRIVMQMSRVSDRGFLRHVAYLVEAANLLPRMRRAGIEHVHVHFGTNATAVARLIKHLGGPTYSFTIHGPDEFDAPVALSLGPKVVDALFVVVISQFGAAQLRRWVGPDHWSKINIIHCSVDSCFLDAECTEPPSSRTFVCVGRLSAQKGHMILLEAFAKVVADEPRARLVLAGDGELREFVEQRITDLGLSDHVEITGWISEQQVRDHLAQARAMVLPSFAEGLPVVIMESLAMLRPVISTVIAGIPELVRDGENGWLVSAGSVDELAHAMRQALSAPADVLVQMGRAGRQRVRVRHCLATEVDRLEMLLERALSGRGADGPTGNPPA